MCYRFPIFGVYVVVIVFGECVIVFQSKTLRHESNVHPLHISYDRQKKPRIILGPWFKGLGVRVEFQHILGLEFRRLGYKYGY